MSDDQTTQQTGNRAGLLVACLGLLVVDVVFLGLAIAFGPGGFGGDRTMSEGELAVAHLGQAAGLVGCLLGGAAAVWVLAVDPHLSPNRGVRWIVVAQLIATTVLVVSTL